MSLDSTGPRRRSVERLSNDEHDAYDEAEVDGFIAAHDREARQESAGRTARYRLFWSFAAFGLLNNVLYVIILSAALDLVPATTPKGVVALFNIFPALMAKVGWPFISSGEIRYTRRMLFCTSASWLGIVIVAMSSGLYPRLFGISLASLSSGLGELTFLQMSTTFPTRSSQKTALAAWSSGTGFAGVGGAGLWWLLRGLGVKKGLGISSFLPLCFPATFFFLLPKHHELQSAPSTAYEPLPTGAITDTSPRPAISALSPDTKGRDAEYHLSTQEKLTLLRPLLLRYMLPLFMVYAEEYMINSGVAPTLVFPVPNKGLWSYFFKTPRDYYPFWSLTYQTFVFISRSFLSLGIPPLSRRLLPLPTVVQGLNLLVLCLQASRFILSPRTYTPPNTPPANGTDPTITRVFFLICVEGLCGGSAYVNAFYHVGREGEGEDGLANGHNRAASEDDDDEEVGSLSCTKASSHDEEIRRKTEREFRIGATGAADSCGILLASLLSMPLEISLCNAQMASGRDTCRNL